MLTPNALALTHPLLPADATANTRTRVGAYLDWLRMARLTWLEPDLASYRDYLFAKGYVPSSVAAHLSTVRGRYRKVLRSNDLRDALYNQQPEGLTPADRKALVDELIERVNNAIHPDTAPVQIVTFQDYEPHLRLNPAQVKQLVTSPNMRTLPGLRDAALIHLMLATGLREEETALLDVADLYRTYEGENALEVRRGKGAKQRMVLYGDLEQWCLDVVDSWLVQAGIEAGAVFRGFWKNGVVRPTRLNKRSIQFILAQHQITHRGKPYTVTAHDLRYTYARHMRESGMSVEAIQKNMGHAKAETTMRYIGNLSAALRRPIGNVYG